jgi:hypothetical protein
MRGSLVLTDIWRAALNLVRTDTAPSSNLTVAGASRADRYRHTARHMERPLTPNQGYRTVFEFRSICRSTAQLCYSYLLFR